jgi:predicted  nucleic acid-binding Zn-ribbon protein
MNHYTCVNCGRWFLQSEQEIWEGRSPELCLRCASKEPEESILDFERREDALTDAKDISQEYERREYDDNNR